MPVVSTPVALAFLASILLGLAMIVAQRGVRSVPTLPGAAFSNVSGAIFFWLVAPFFWDGDGISAVPFAIFVLVGIFFPAVVTLLMLEGNRRMGPSISAAISGTTPLFAYVGAVLLLGEALVGQGLAGTVIIVLGIAILVWRKGGARGSFPAWVVALPVGSAVIRATAQLMIKFGLALWPNAFAAILIAYTASAATTGSLMWIRRERCPWTPALAWLSLTGIMNGLGVLALYIALREGDVTVIAPIAATSPVVTLIVSALILREEKLTARLMLGVLVTLGGVTLILLR